MKTVDLRKYKFKVDDYVVFVNNEDAKESLKALVTELRNDTEFSVELNLLIMESNGSYTAGTKFWHKLERDGNPVLGIVAPKEATIHTEAALQSSSLEDQILYRTVVFLTPYARTGHSAQVSKVIDDLKLQGILAKDIRQERAKKIFYNAINMRKERFWTKNGWIRLEGTAHVARSSASNVTNGIRVVDKDRVQKAIGACVVELLEAGLFGPVVWKVD